MAPGDAEGRTIEVNAAELYYEEHGSGTPLVLLHGGFSSSATWAPLLDQLDGFRVITPDSRGHGRSTNPAGRLSYPQLADDVAGLVAELGLDRPFVGGWSDGGQVALELGARHPAAARALIVGGAYPDFAGAGLRDGMREFLGADEDGNPDLDALDAALGGYAEIAKSRHPGGEEQWRALVEQSAPMWLDYEGLAPEAVAAIAVPTLIFTGDRDELLPLDLIVSLYRALPDAELAVCPSADHFAFPGAGAAQLAGLIRDFADRRGA